jgi:hypothetical protein
MQFLPGYSAGFADFAKIALVFCRIYQTESPDLCRLFSVLLLLEVIILMQTSFPWVFVCLFWQNWEGITGYFSQRLKFRQTEHPVCLLFP